jgi:hypothetical protein
MLGVVVRSYCVVSDSQSFSFRGAPGRHFAFYGTQRKFPSLLFVPEFELGTVLLADSMSYCIMDPFQRTVFTQGMRENG